MAELEPKQKVTQKRRRRRPSVAEQVEKRDRKTQEQTETMVGPDPSDITEDRLIPSGITVLNCACSDNPHGAFALGTINTIPGKSVGGKTILMLNMLATCAADPRFKEYDLILDDSEQAMAFNLKYLFPPLIGRLTYPQIDEETNQPLPSETIQDFKGNVLLRCKGVSPFIYVLDSLDSLTSTEELEREYTKAIANAKSTEAVKELKGSYKMEKAKHIGEVLRMINGYIKHSDSALFLVQQTRQRINAERWQTDWVTSGGEAPFFYSFHQVFLSQATSHKEEAMGLKHKIGGTIQLEVIKNKLTGKRRRDGLTVPIWDDYGMDDVASCIDFLKKTKHWKSDSGGITATEFDIKLSRENLIKHIEDNALEHDMKNIVGKIWNKAEDQLRLNRTRRF